MAITAASISGAVSTRAAAERTMSSARRITSETSSSGSLGGVPPGGRPVPQPVPQAGGGGGGGEHVVAGDQEEPRAQGTGEQGGEQQGELQGEGDDVERAGAGGDEGDVGDERERVQGGTGVAEQAVGEDHQGGARRGSSCAACGRTRRAGKAPSSRLRGRWARTRRAARA